MNQIIKTPLRNLGYDFIPAEYLPEGKDEYYLRNEQHKPSVTYSHLKLDEVEELKKNGNNADDWNLVMVTGNFLPDLCIIAIFMDWFESEFSNLFIWNFIISAVRLALL